VRQCEKVKYILIGYLISVLVFGSSPAFAGSVRQQITALYNNIKVVVDGKPVQFGKDGAGKQIEPFIYNGTTYLPVKAVGEALNKEVSWDGSTNTVYIGSKLSEQSYLTEVLPPYSSSNDAKVYTLSSSEKLTMGGKTYNTGYTLGGWSNAHLIFNLDAKYNEITGTLGAIDWESLESNRYFNIYLDGELYKSIEVINKDLPQEITISVSGIKQLRIESPWSGNDVFTIIGFGDVIIK